MINKRQKGIAVALVAFIILVSIAVAQNYRASANVGLMANVEQFSIVNIRFIAGNNVEADQVKITLQNSGYNSVTITNGYLNGTQATSMSPQPAVVNEGYSAFVTLTFKPNTLVDGSQYEIKIISTRGTSTVNGQKFDASYTTQHNFDEPLPKPIPSRAQVETENRILLTIMATIIMISVVTSGLIFYSKIVHQKEKVCVKKQAINVGTTGLEFSYLCIGFGLVFFCLSILLGFQSIVSLIIAITPVILFAILINIERQKNLFSVRKIALGFLLVVLVFLLLRFAPGFQSLLFLLGSADFLTLLLVGCGFFSIGLIGMYIDKKPESLALLFLMLALLFFAFVPVAAMYKEVDYFEFYVPISQRYPIQLSLAGLSFLLWSILSKLFARFYSSRTLSSTISTDEISKPELDRTLNLSDKLSFNGIKLIGFLLLIIAPIGFMGAAYIYQPNISMDIFFGTRTSFVEFSLLMVSVSTGLFIFGGVSMINQKSKLLVSLVAVGSLILVGATLAYVYQAPITSLTFGYIPTINFSTIYRVYALPLFITSIVSYAVGIILMLKARVNNYQGIFKVN